MDPDGDAGSDTSLESGKVCRSVCPISLNMSQVRCGHPLPRHRPKLIPRGINGNKMLETSPRPGYHRGGLDAVAAWQKVGVQLSSVPRTTSDE